MEGANNPEDHACDFINNPSSLLIASCRKCSQNAKVVFIRLEHIFLVQIISKREYKELCALTKYIEEYFQMLDYHIGIYDQSSALPCFTFITKSNKKILSHYLLSPYSISSLSLLIKSFIREVLLLFYRRGKRL